MLNFLPEWQTRPDLITPCCFRLCFCLGPTHVGRITTQNKITISSTLTLLDHCACNRRRFTFTFSDYTINHVLGTVRADWMPQMGISLPSIAEPHQCLMLRHLEFLTSNYIFRDLHTSPLIFTSVLLWLCCFFAFIYLNQ